MVVHVCRFKSRLLSFLRCLLAQKHISHVVLEGVFRKYMFSLKNYFAERFKSQGKSETKFKGLEK